VRAGVRGRGAEATLAGEMAPQAGGTRPDRTLSERAQADLRARLEAERLNALPQAQECLDCRRKGERAQP
jgi:hypothetical protein